MVLGNYNFFFPVSSFGQFLHIQGLCNFECNKWFKTYKLFRNSEKTKNSNFEEKKFTFNPTLTSPSGANLQCKT